MTLAPPEPNWWNRLPVADVPLPSDLGAKCGHTLDRHDPVTGACMIDHRVISGGGFEGDILDPVSRTVTGSAIVESSEYVREGCFCPGEEQYHKVGLPADFLWDTLTGTQWRDPAEIKTPDGRYKWWIGN